MRTHTFFATLALLGLGIDAAAAHAFLDHASPRVGTTVSAAPREVTLWFTQKLEAAFSAVMVTDGAGQRVDMGGTRVNGNVMSVTLRGGGAGTYRVHWKVLSVDAHTTEGNFTFRVGQ
jgi:methionine-rich copper-binding protein CopC